MDHTQPTIDSSVTREATFHLALKRTGGGMAELVHAKDWIQTPLGPMSEWPTSLRTLVDMLLVSPFPICLLWGTDFIQIYNDAFSPIVAARNPAPLGQSNAECFPEIWHLIEPMYGRILLGESFSLEDEMYPLIADGILVNRYFTVSLSPVSNDKGLISGVLISAFETTKRVEAEKAQSQSQAERERLQHELDKQSQRLNATFQQSPTFMTILEGPNFVFVQANEAYYQVVGKRDIIGRAVLEVLPEVNGQGFIELLEKVYNTGEPFFGKAMPFAIEQGPGMPRLLRYVDLAYQAIREKDGAITAIGVHGLDVTELKLAQDEQERLQHELDTQTARLYASFQKSPALMAIIRGPNYVFEQANEQYYELVGKRDLIGKTLREALPEVEGQGFIELLDEVYRTGEPFVGKEVAIQLQRDADKPIELRYVDFIYQALRDSDGSSSGILAHGFDVTEYKIAREERDQLLGAEREARQNAENANRLKDEFLATLSHELRTPLNSILGWSQFLRMDPRPEQIQEGIEVIERSARAQTKLIEDLLDMSRIVSGKMLLNVQLVDPIAAISAAVETIKPTANAKGITLQTFLDPRVGTILCDPVRLQQMVWNLLTNAIKFTPKPGSVRLALTRINGHAEISVTDTGIGIKPEFLPHVFERFRQADAAITRKYGGLGIGLSIVKNLTEQHGGTLQVRSAGPDMGSTFTIVFPSSVLDRTGVLTHTGEDDDRPLPNADFVAQHPLDLAYPTLAGLKVLAVDDDPDARGIMQRILRGAGVVVQSASTGAEALKLIIEFKPDLLICDIGMPEMDGYELLTNVRKLTSSQGGTTPAIALTAFARSEDRTRALAIGYSAHISKPVEPAQLLATIAAVTALT